MTLCCGISASCIYSISTDMSTWQNAVTAWGIKSVFSLSLSLSLSLSQVFVVVVTQRIISRHGPFCGLITYNSKPYFRFFSISVLYLSCVILFSLLKFLNIVSRNSPVLKVQNLVRKKCVFSKVNNCVLPGKGSSTVVVVVSFW